MKAEHFECTFSDLRGRVVVLNLVKGWVSVCGWITLLNKRGSTWRKLGGGRKDDLKEDTAVALMVEFPALIKRPIFVWNRNVIVGFKKEQKDEIIRLATQR
jgi:arsenate reductase-like glutaredoxin family protein